MQEQNTNPTVLEEGAWSKAKYMVAKLGRLEKGGKIIGRGKEAKAAAAQVEDTLQKESAKLLKGFVGKISKEYPEFPNMESHEKFLECCELYTAFYDSMAFAPTGYPPNHEYFLPAVAANAAIQDLRVVWKHFLDYKLATVYQTMNEGLEEDTVGTSLDTANKTKHSNPISTFNHDSTTMKTLKSNKLPILLATLGSSLGAFGWILKTPFMQDWLNHLFDHTKDIVEYVNGNQVLGAVGNGEGITQTLERLYPNVDLSPNAPVGNLQKVLTQIGDGNQDAGLKSISGMLKNPDKVGELKQMLASGKFRSIKELFNQHAGDPTSGKGGSWFETIKDGKLSVNVKQQIIKTVAVQGVKLGAVGAGIGSFLAPLGIALVAAGVTTKLLRMKGQKSSRAQIMNDLLLSWELLPMEDAGSSAMVQLGVVKATPAAAPATTGKGETGLATTNKQTGVATTGAETGVATQQGKENPQRNALGARKSNFNSNASDIEDAQIIDDEPEQKGLGAGAAQLGPGNPVDATADGSDAQTNPERAPDRGGDGNIGVDEPAKAPAKTNLLGRLNPEGNKNAAANLKAFGDTITTADKRSPQDITDEIEYLTYAVKEIPTKTIMPKIAALTTLIKSKDATKQLQAIKGLRTLSALIKNWYVAALKNYSEDTSNALRNDMSYTEKGGLQKNKKKQASGQTELPLNEAYTTPLFDAAPGREDVLLGSLGQAIPKLLRQLQNGQAMTPEQVTYVVQKLNSGSFQQKSASKNQEPGLVQRIIKEINKWLLIRINDYKQYLKHLQNNPQGEKQEEPETAAEVVNESTLNPFLDKNLLNESTLNPFLVI